MYRIIKVEQTKEAILTFCGVIKYLREPKWQ